MEREEEQREREDGGKEGNRSKVGTNGEMERRRNGGRKVVGG